MDRPILVSGPLIKPIQLGLKTDTRLTRDLDIVNDYPDNWEFVEMDDDVAVFKHTPGKLGNEYIKSPYGMPGDLLWVRESFYVGRGYDGVKPRDFPSDNYVKRGYMADGPKPDWAGRTVPGIHMPKAFSRLTLKLTGVRVERLHEITEEGAALEGVQRGFVRVDTSGRKNKYSFEANHNGNYLRGFYMTWIELNGRESWYANPWVWVLSFKKLINGTTDRRISDMASSL